MPTNDNRDGQRSNQRQPQSSQSYQRASDDRDEEGPDSELEDEESREPQSSSDQTGGKLRNRKPGSDSEEGGRQVQGNSGRSGDELEDEDDQQSEESADVEDSEDLIEHFRVSSGDSRIDGSEAEEAKPRADRDRN